MILFLQTSLLCGCTSVPSRSHTSNLQSLMQNRNFSNAVSVIAQAKDAEYGENNAVLYYLNLGMAQHAAGEFVDSDHSLDLAQCKMEELYTKSVTKHAARYVADDTTVPYSGAPFERALSYVFRALNYIYSGNSGEALVEIRKSNIFLSEFSRFRKYQKYTDDAFVQYMGSLLYEDGGQVDDARISMEDAAKAYRRYRITYGIAMPDFKLNRVKKIQQGELVFLHYNGMAPFKVSEILKADRKAIESAYSGKVMDERIVNALENMYPGDAVSIAYPKYYSPPHEIISSEIMAGTSHARTMLVEDITAIANGELTNDISSIINRAMTRYSLKTWLAFLTSDSQGRGGTNLSTTESADTRCWTILPGEIRMSRMLLKPGKHTIVAVFKNQAGRDVLTQTFENVIMAAGKRTYLHFWTTK